MRTIVAQSISEASAGSLAAFSQQLQKKLSKTVILRAVRAWVSRTGTCVAVEHSKAVCVMVPKELGSDHPVVLLHNSQVPLVKAPPEPGLAPFLLKEARRDVPHNVDLEKQELP